MTGDYAVLGYANHNAATLRNNYGPIMTLAIMLRRLWQRFYWWLPWNRRKLVRSMWTGNLVVSSRVMQGKMVE